MGIFFIRLCSRQFAHPSLTAKCGADAKPLRYVGIRCLHLYMHSIPFFDGRVRLQSILQAMMQISDVCISSDMEFPFSALHLRWIVHSVTFSALWIVGRGFGVACGMKGRWNGRYSNSNSLRYIEPPSSNLPQTRSYSFFARYARSCQL